MTIAFPWALALLALLPVFWRWHRSSLVPSTPGRRSAALAVRVTIFVLLVLALTDPRWLASSRAVHVVWLVDASRSVAGEGVAAAQRLRESAGGGGGETWIAFGGRSVLVADPDKLKDLPPGETDDRETALAEALQVAEASFPAGRVRTIALVTDGRETRGAAAAVAPALARSRVRVHTFPAAPPDRPEVLVRAVDAPRQVRADEPFAAEVEVSSNRETDAEISLFRNGAKVATRQERLKPGSTRLSFRQTLEGDERLVELSAEVRVAEDTLADNNRASAIVQTEGRSKVLLLSDKPEQARYLGWALKQEGILLDARPPGGAPTTLADLQNYDLVILDNVPATNLSVEQTKLLATYVRDFGGGFLMTGGDQAFGLGGYFRTPVEEILPVRCDFEKEKETPSLAMVFVIDRSGSMSGEKIEMAKEAAKAALELLGPQDYAGVVAFDNEAFWAAELRSAAEKGETAAQISAIAEGGGTNLAPGMELAYQALRSSPAKIRHAILLTDGVSTPGPFYELATRMAAEKITVSTVAVGGDADTRLLEQIANWGGGRYYLATDPRTVPQIFAKETMAASKSAIQEAPFVPVPVRPADFLQGLAFDTAPFLLGYVTTRPKPTAEIWLASEKGEPLLATWRYGLGQAGAWTSDARNRWAVEWLRWEGFGRFWAQLVRRLARAEAVSKFAVTLDQDRGEFVLRADTVDALGRLVGGLDAEVLVTAPDGTSRRKPLTRIAPGRLETRWAADQIGGWHAQVTFSRDGEIVERQTVSAAADYPAEFLPGPPDEDLLRALARETGGTFQPPAEAIWKDDRSATEEKELWPWLASLALLVFLADVALKRWPRRLPQTAPARPARTPVGAGS